MNEANAAKDAERESVLQEQKESMDKDALSQREVALKERDEAHQEALDRERQALEAIK